jgi:hypothetical protein
MSYFEGDDLLHYENETIRCSGARKIVSESQVVRSIKSRNDGSQWQLKIAVPNNIVVSVQKHGDHRALFAFGEISDQVVASDFIFSIGPHDETVVIPRHIFWRNYERYSNNAEIACSELLQVDNPRLKNIHYKVPVSNRLKFLDFPRKVNRAISEFTDPLGRAFDDNWIINQSSGLPIPKEVT